MRGKNRPRESRLPLEVSCAHFVLVSQLAGNSLHRGLCTDLDVGYGIEQTPEDLDTIADLARIPAMLQKRGYKEEDIANIMHGNFLRLLHEAWAE